jgi:hypothetical protein
MRSKVIRLTAAENVGAGSGVDLISRALGVSAEVVRAYDFANRDEAAAAAKEGRIPTRPPSTLVTGVTFTHGLACDMIVS